MTSTVPARKANTIALLAELERAGAVIDNGLHLPPGLTYERYEALGLMLRYAHDMIQWLIGDWLLYGEQEYRDDIYTQAAAITGKADQTLINWASNARRVPASRRRPNVVYSIHAEVASLPPAAQKRLLKEAETEHLTKREVRDRKREILGEPEVVVECCPQCGRPL